MVMEQAAVRPRTASRAHRREIAAKIFKQPAVGAGRRGEAVGKTWNLVSAPSRPVPPTPPKTGRDGREQTFG
ncbi:MAG: hypothetical protein BroJett015_37950 [Chloroflexota bacterium]|nr:MAG: hypothetical protein BroJett015_37950 [Chloroflexota bacterium]